MSTLTNGASGVSKSNVPEGMRMPKKLIVLCDGTWQNADNGWEKPGFIAHLLGNKGESQVPSNIPRFARALKSESEDASPQVIYYQAGVGTGWSMVDHLFGGGLGHGISQHIREAYGFLVHNYSKDSTGIPDEIYLVGFSRGAFTARSVGGMISTLGLLTKDAMVYFWAIFDDFESAGEKNHQLTIKTAFPELGFNINVTSDNAPKFLAAYRKELDRLNLTRDVSIKAIGVWDTVGSLGLPIRPFLQKVFGFASTLHRYRWYDTGISDKVENAFHALALDERRAAFDATVWEKEKDHTTNLNQVWFSGSHSNVGGSYPDSNNADITLAWMMDQFKPFLSFNEDYIVDQFNKNITKHYKNFAATEQDKATATKNDWPDWKWGLGVLVNSLKFPTSIAGSTNRKPGQYRGLHYDTGKPKQQLLHHTHECIHASVRARKELGGLDYPAWFKTSLYGDNPVLKDWTLQKEIRDGVQVVSWKYHNPKDSKDIANGRVLPEAPLGELETRLLREFDLKTMEFLFSTAEPSRATSNVPSDDGTKL